MRREPGLQLMLKGNWDVAGAETTVWRTAEDVIRTVMSRRRDHLFWTSDILSTGEF